MRRKTNEQFLYEINRDLPNLEPLEEYKNNRTKILMRCKVCNHKFKVLPASLYMKHGCPKCAGIFKTHEMFVEELKIKHPKMSVISNYNRHTAGKPTILVVG